MAVLSLKISINDGNVFLDFVFLDLAVLSSKKSINNGNVFLDFVCKIFKPRIRVAVFKSVTIYFQRFTVSTIIFKICLTLNNFNKIFGVQKNDYY